MSSLFADYLGFVRGAPKGRKPARSHVQLMALATPHFSHGTMHSLKTADYWHAFSRVDRLLGAWLRSPQAFRPPDTWWDGCPLQGLVTPFEFARDFVPQSRGKDVITYGGRRYHNHTYGLPDIVYVAAYAHGWELNTKERDKAQVVAAALVELPQVLLYASYTMGHVPMPFSNYSYRQRISARARLHDDPLSLRGSALTLALPKWAATSQAIRNHGLPRTEVAGSSNTGYILNLDGTRRR